MERETVSTKVIGQCLDEERALYHLQDAEVIGCTFAGPADGESALKECRQVAVRDCRFSLRYPLWHAQNFRLENTTMDSLTRAPLWYASDGVIADCQIDGVKCLRECERITLRDCDICSPEFGWKCRDVTLNQCELESEYLLFEAENVTIDQLNMKGKYSFQYIHNMRIDHSQLDTKDAFWHSKNVTVENSLIKGEYLGWYSEGLTLIRCKIVGTQPLCYCKNLTLIDCTMEETDLAFEYSEVQATVQGNILSVKNPLAGSITADEIGEVILENSIMNLDCRIQTRKKPKL